MDYKSLREFAAEKKVTMRAIQRHIKNHENDLEGHIVRYGPPKGTYIDQAAQEYISELLVGYPMEVVDTELQAEIERLKNEVADLQRRLIQLQDEKAGLLERALEAEKVKALAEATAQDKERQLSSLQQEIREARDRAEKAEAETQALKRRSLWQRITRFGE